MKVPGDTSEAAGSPDDAGSYIASGSLRLRPRGLSLAVLFLSASCHHPTAPSTATLAFHIDAPFCGGSTPFDFRFTLDTTVLSTERLHDTSTSLNHEVAVGPHRVRVELVESVLVGIQDTSLTFRAGERLVDEVSVYCS